MEDRWPAPDVLDDARYVGWGKWHGPRRCQARLLRDDDRCRERGRAESRDRHSAVSLAH